MKIFGGKIMIFFFIFAQNIDCGYMLESTRHYPQSIFWSKNRKNKYTPAYPSFTTKVGYKGIFISQTCFPDASESSRDPPDSKSNASYILLQSLVRK